MENRSLGRGRVSVPVVGLGTWQRLEAAASGQHRELINTAVAVGIRLIDTSPMYSDAERLLADGLGVKRDKVIIAGRPGQIGGYPSHGICEGADHFCYSAEIPIGALAARPRSRMALR